MVYRKGNVVYMGKKRLGVIYPGKKTFATFRSITKHLFRAYNGWGFNRELLEYLADNGVIWIEVRDERDGKIYRVTVKTVLAKGIPHYYEEEEQRILPLEYWDVYEIPTRQHKTRNLMDYMGD